MIYLHKTHRIQHGNVFEARQSSEVPVYLDSQPRLFDNLKDLCFLELEDVQIVKQVESKSPALPECQLIDLKTQASGPFEDQVYTAFPVLIKNIRRGNTIIKHMNTYSLGRKGLEKFFDLRLEFVDESRYDDTCLDDEHHLQKNYILAGPLRAMLDGKPVEVIKTLKANGENM